MVEYKYIFDYRNCVYLYYLILSLGQFITSPNRRAKITDGWFIDTGPIASTMSLKWLIEYNCFNPIEVIELPQTLDLH